MPKERDLDRLANLDSLALLHENLSCVLASVLAVKRRHTVLFGVVALLEGLECGHEVVATSDTVGDDALCDTSGDGALYDGSDGVHGTNDLGLELRRYVQLDLLEQILGRTETTDNEHVL